MPEPDPVPRSCSLSVAMRTDDATWSGPRPLCATELTIGCGTTRRVTPGRLRYMVPGRRSVSDGMASGGMVSDDRSWQYDRTLSNPFTDRPMQLEGSCHCGAVRFTVESTEYVPYQRCYCSICRKTAGSGGFAVNLGAHHETLKVTGESEITVYQAVLDRIGAGSDRTAGQNDTAAPARSPARRHFCRHCGSPLWLWDPRWPELVHPHAGAIDTPLPLPPSRTHIFVDSKPDWVTVDERPGDARCPEYPEESLEQWHRRHGAI